MSMKFGLKTLALAATCALFASPAGAVWTYQDGTLKDAESGWMVPAAIKDGVLDINSAPSNSKAGTVLDMTNVGAEIGEPITTFSTASRGLLKEVTELRLPKTVTSISGFGCREADALVKVTGLDVVTRIGTHCFWGCSELATLEGLDFEAVTSIGGYAFDGCKSFPFGDLVLTAEEIGCDAFMGCLLLTSVTLAPKGGTLTLTGEAAFQDCDGLTGVVIRATSLSMGDTGAGANGIFGKNGKLTSVFWDVPPPKTMHGTNGMFTYTTERKVTNWIARGKVADWTGVAGLIGGPEIPFEPTDDVLWTACQNPESVANTRPAQYIAVEPPKAESWGWSNLVTVAGQDYCLIAFTNTASVSTWTVPEGVKAVETLVVGGGGGGGGTTEYGGGGGAGGLIEKNLSVTPGQVLSIRVGRGGEGATSSSASANGGGSSISHGGTALAEVDGGGAGGCGGPGSAGACGGGGAKAKNGGDGTAGYAGYRGTSSGGGAGGGGMRGGGEAGGETLATPVGVPGAGAQSRITGRLVTYATGGIGGAVNITGSAAGANGTGNGGCGAPKGKTDGFRGGDGIVFIRYFAGGGEPTPVETEVWGISNVVKVASSDYCVLTFTNVARTWTWTVPDGVLTLDYLVVGGGGGGGGFLGGGGGAGGFLAGQGIKVAPGDKMVVAVGAGGRGGAVRAVGGMGEDSAFGDIRAWGGGGGAYHGMDALGNGGSGGGGSSSGAPGRASDAKQGHDGGEGVLNTYSGGGGGAGGAGQAGGEIPNKGGDGGAGMPSDITGHELFYAGGGGACGDSSKSIQPGVGHDGGGTGGLAGDGHSATSPGSGGGGGDRSGRGGNGADGVVILRYRKGGDCTHPSFEPIPAVAPTCTEPGNAAGGSRCTVCGLVKEAAPVVPALGHNLVPDPESDREATCRVPGIEGSQKCARCDYRKPGHETGLGAHHYEDGLCTVCGIKEPTGCEITGLSADFTGGVNYESVKVAGVVGLNAADYASARLTVRLKLLSGFCLATRTKDLTPGSTAFSFEFDEAIRGYAYLAEAEVTASDGRVIAGATVGGFAAGVQEWSPGWVRESASTYKDGGGATGKWVAFAEGMAKAESGAIAINTFDEGAQAYRTVAFQPGNPVKDATGVAYRFRATFPEASTSEPDVTGVFGVTVCAGEQGEQFLVLDEGRWVRVPRSRVAPKLGAEYLVAVYVDFRAKGVGYFVTDGEGATTYLWSGLTGSDAQGVSELVFRGEGRVAVAEGDLADPGLVRATVTFDDSRVGVNFTNLTVGGGVTIKKLHETDVMTGVVKVALKDAAGNVAQTFDIAFDGEGTYAFSDRLIEGLRAGEGYTMEVKVVLDAPDESLPRVVGDLDVSHPAYAAQATVANWIDEDAATFAGEKEGTGDWLASKADEVFLAEDGRIGRCIGINTSTGAAVQFEPWNRDEETLRSSLREIRSRFVTTIPGFSLSEPIYPAAFRSDDLSCLTVAHDDVNGTGKNYFAVMSNGVWAVSEVEATLGAVVEIATVLNYRDACISYYLVEGSVRTPITTVLPDGPMPELSAQYHPNVRYSGSGLVVSLQGDCYDSHLATDGQYNYWTIDEAIKAASATTNVITPLWNAIAEVGVGAGSFGVNDPEGLLTLVWRKGYAVTSCKVGEVTYYVFSVSDRWIDWAEESGVIAKGGGYHVLTEAGLAWLARMALEGPIEESVTLDADLPNLGAHEWTPISGFTGTFDGGGHAIAGLRGGDADEAFANAQGVTGYGLFATAENATFRNVTFREVSVSNAAEAVAALLGVGTGSLTVEGVAVESGRIVGTGAKVAGVVGLADSCSALVLACNTNGAALVNAAIGPGRATAGIANIGGPAEGDGPMALTVTGNRNVGAIATSLSCGQGGGNAAQVVAGTRPGAEFDPERVNVTDNVGAGDTSAVAFNGMTREYVGGVPIVNLASEIALLDANGYRQYVEANGGVAAIDPEYGTARMSGASFVNGTPNHAGRIGDDLTLIKAGGTYVLAGDTILWEPIPIDRNVTIDLGGHVVEQVFLDDAFRVEAGATATIGNGKVICPKGRFARGDCTKGTGLTVVEWTENYWEREVMVDDIPLHLAALDLQSVVNAGCRVEIPADSPLAIDADTAQITLGGVAVAPVSKCYDVRRSVTAEGSVRYEVVLKPDAELVPELALDLVPTEGTPSTIVVSGASCCLSYTLQYASEIGGSWQDLESVTPAYDDEPIVFSVVCAEPSGFYRIAVSEKRD